MLLSDRDALLDKQGGVCDICLRFLVFGGRGKDKANVDRCHLTGKVRGILCGGCNSGLGNFRALVPALLEAAVYLQRQT